MSDKVTRTNKNPVPELQRRWFIAAGALAVIGFAGYRAGWYSRLLGVREFDFQAIDDPAGFRKLPVGAISVSGVPLFGLDNEKDPGLVAAEAEIGRDICGSLFGPGPRPASDVPIAYFFDYQCPICRRLTPVLRRLQGVQIEWHDLAGLGASSVVAARATIAAGKQDAYDVFHDRLMRARFQATDGYVALLAESVGIDPDLLISDMQDASVDQRMWLSRALSNKFGMVGTPGLSIGRTIVIGDISEADLKRLIEIERADPGVCA
ncbi:MAG: DsbA family protein [Paracoccaceae bacterium]